MDRKGNARKMKQKTEKKKGKKCHKNHEAPRRTCGLGGSAPLTPSNTTLVLRGFVTFLSFFLFSLFFLSLQLLSRDFARLTSIPRVLCCRP